MLLPALLADQSVDLAALLAQMHDHTGHGGVPAPAGETSRRGSQATVLSAAAAGSGGAGPRRGGGPGLPDRRVGVGGAARDPAGPGGQGDRRAARPHPPGRRPRPGRTADGGGRTPAAAPGRRPGSGRPRPAPARRHEAIFSAYQAWLPGTGFVLVNDHDPKPLRYQFEAEHAGQFTWDYLEAGPEVWRVRIGRPAAAAREAAAGTPEPWPARTATRRSRTWTCGRSATRSGTG